MSEEQHVLVDLDSIMDTRLAVVSMLNPKAAQVLMSEAYYTRLSDDFEAQTGGLITNSEYREAWDTRDASVLQYTRVTNMILMMEQLFKTLTNNMMNTPFCEGVRLTVNTWPYRLSEEATELLLTCCQAISGIAVKVEAVWLPPESLTPAWIKDNLAAMIMYDYQPWLVAQDAALIKTPMPEIVVFIPALSYSTDSAVQNCVVNELDGGSPFALTEQGLSVFFSAQMLTAGFFSIIRL